MRVDEYAFGERFLPINHMDGVQNADQLAELLAFDTVKDYENWIARLQGFGAYLDQTIALMRGGIEKGLVQPRVIMERVPAQIAKQIVEDPTASPFYGPFRTMPESIPAARTGAPARQPPGGDRGQRRARLPSFRHVLQQGIPAGAPRHGRHLGTFRAATSGTATHPLVHDDRPDRRRRSTRSACAKWRASAARWSGSIDQVGFKGTLPEFFAVPAHRSALLLQATAKSCCTAYRAMSQADRPAAAEAVRHAAAHALWRASRSPSTSPPTRRPPTTSGPPPTARAPGTYFVNLYKPEARPKYEMAALSLHEAVPGHHLQIALRHGARRAAAVPPLLRASRPSSRAGGSTPRALGDEMGLYEDPYAKFGQLTYEMWRAVRLVVDTGMHAQAAGPAQQAIDFFKENARQDRARHRQRNRPLHRLAGPGAGLQDRRAQDPGAARASGQAARREVRRARVPRRGAAAAARCRSTCSRRNVARWQKQVAKGGSASAGADRP